MSGLFMTLLINLLKFESLKIQKWQTEVVNRKIDMHYLLLHWFKCLICFRRLLVYISRIVPWKNKDRRGRMVVGV